MCSSDLLWKSVVGWYAKCRCNWKICRIIYYFWYFVNLKVIHIFNLSCNYLMRESHCFKWFCNFIFAKCSGIMIEHFLITINKWLFAFTISFATAYEADIICCNSEKRSLILNLILNRAVFYIICILRIFSSCSAW